MSVINESHKNLLALHCITLKNETKNHVVIQLKDSTNDTKISNNLYNKLLSAIENHISHKDVPDYELPEISFGVELEFVGSSNQYDISKFQAKMSRLLGENFFASFTYTHNDGKSWILGVDNSIERYDPLLRDPNGYELSSPKLKLNNPKDIETLKTVIYYCKEFLHASVNSSCGTHIHIGFKHDKTFRGNICEVLSAYGTMEKLIFDPIVPTSRRRNKYCKQTRPFVRNKYQKLSSRYCDFTYDGECKDIRFEFRQLEGTLDLQTIMYWAELQTNILYDLLDHSADYAYTSWLMNRNIFEILLYYFDKNSSLVNFFISRVIDFKSRTLTSCN